MVKISQAHKTAIYNLIGLLIMLFFSFIPIQSDFITPMGMKVIGIFLGTIFLWSIGEMIWPSIISVALLAWMGYMPMPELLKEWMGSSTVVMIFFLLVLVGTFQYHGCTNYIARFFLTRKVMERRPWIFTFVMLLGTYLVATFVNPWAGVFLFLPIVQNACQTLGFEKRDQYTQLMTITVIMAALLGFPSSYFNGTIYGLNANYMQISGQEIPGGKYMLIAIVLGITMLACFTLCMKYILKPDVTPLEDLTIDQLNQNPLPPINRTQKIVSITLLVFIFLMLFPVIFSHLALSRYFKENISGIAMTLVGFLALLHIDGQSVLDFPAIMKDYFSWPTYFIIATSLLLGDALTSEAVGITDLLEHVLTPLFSSMSLFVFILAVVFTGAFFSNFTNSVVVLLILHPIIYTYSITVNADMVPVVILATIATIGFAAITPSASPYAATIFAQKEFVQPIKIYKYASLFVLIELIIIFAIGIPLIYLLF